jgi:hypothetical protein
LSATQILTRALDEITRMMREEVMRQSNRKAVRNVTRRPEAQGKVAVVAAAPAPWEAVRLPAWWRRLRSRRLAMRTLAAPILSRPAASAETTWQTLLGSIWVGRALEKFGERGVAACFSRAKPFPVKGLYKLSEFPDAGTLRTYSTGFGSLDPSTDRHAPYIQLYAGCFMIVSGLPGGGSRCTPRRTRKAAGR